MNHLLCLVEWAAPSGFVGGLAPLEDARRAYAWTGKIRFNATSVGAAIPGCGVAVVALLVPGLVAIPTSVLGETRHAKLGVRRTSDLELAIRRAAIARHAVAVFTLLKVLQHTIAARTRDRIAGVVGPCLDLALALIGELPNDE
jgi:hypothetical protein